MNLNRLIISIFLIIFSLQSLTKADDISDFQIEGMSVGDSALDFFSKELIKNNKADYYKDKTYTPVEIYSQSFYEVYESVDFSYKTDDKNYKIHRISGAIDYRDNIKDCYKKMDEIISELSELFKDDVTQSEKFDTIFYGIDKSGNSKYTSVIFKFKSQDIIRVQCYDYSKETEYRDHLNVEMLTKDFGNFLTYKAYK